MRPESVITSSNPEAGEEVIDNRPESRSARQRHIVCSVKAICRNEDNEGGREPVDMLVPVLDSYRLFTDVYSIH